MRLTLLACAALLAACSPETATETAPDVPAPQIEGVETGPSLDQVWLTTGFNNPEGVAVYNGTLLISNAAGEGNAKDGQGWISRVAMDGAILEEKWVSGLNAPKGMAVRGDILFVTDIDQYHTINADTGEIINTFDVPEAGFLNDATIWNAGVYASDSVSGTIFQLDENGYKAWFDETGFDGANGALGHGDSLLVSTMGGGGLLLSISGARDVTQLASGIDNADGIAALDDGTYLVSSWPGHIWHVGSDGSVTELLNTEPGNIYQNDLTRVGDLIIVPNWEPSTVTAWRVVD